MNCRCPQADTERATTTVLTGLYDVRVGDNIQIIDVAMEN